MAVAGMRGPDSRGNHMPILTDEIKANHVIKVTVEEAVDSFQRR